MTRFVIDAPALLEIIASKASPRAEHQVVAPTLIRSEALELLLHRVLSGALDEATAVELVDGIAGVGMRLLGDRVSRRTAWKLAREHGWTSTSAAEYLAVTRLQADALIAIDPELRRKAEGIVDVARLQDLVG